MCHRLYPPLCAPCELLPCPAAVNRATNRRLCFITEDTRGKVAAGVVNPGAGAGAGEGARAGAEAGVLLECCVAFPLRSDARALRCPKLQSCEAHYHRQCNRPRTLFSSSDREETVNSIEHRTENFPMGGAKCRMTFHTTHEFLYIFPVGESTIIVTVARFFFLCPYASERRTSHSEIMASPCLSLSLQGARKSLLWLMFVALSADHASQNHISVGQNSAQVHLLGEFHKKLSVFYPSIPLLLLSQGYDSTKRVPKCFYATHCMYGHHI